MMQARAAALDFSPGAIDGVIGPMTDKAIAAAVASQKAKGLKFVHPSGIERLHIHWSVTGYLPTADSKKHYHAGIGGDGELYEFNPHTARLAHTLNANGGALGIAVLAMAGAVERPFKWGTAPITPAQLDGLCRYLAMLGKKYDIPANVYGMPTHAEIEPVFGIKQRGKWDITVLPGMTAPGDPVEVGNKIRAIVSRYM
jgi:hypothetical protein